MSHGSQPPRESGANRKLIRPRLDEHGHWPGTKSPPRRRRPLPPRAETGAEAAHFHKQVQLGTTLGITLEDGTVLRGRLRWYDREALCLEAEEGGETVVLKSAILHSVRESGPASERKGQRGS